MKTGIIVMILGITTLAGHPGFGQGIQLGELIIISTRPTTKEFSANTLSSCRNEISSWNAKHQGTEMGLFKADRGDSKGEIMIVYSAKKAPDNESLGGASPFSQFAAAHPSCLLSAELLHDTHAYTKYRLVGADGFKSLPVAGILGIHFIKVRKDRSEAFEKFVAGKLNPAVGHLFPDLQLLYYKSSSGEYITIFALGSTAARDKYWPQGHDAEVLKQAFKPLQGLAKELGPYLEEGSYLEPSTGFAAAYFESKEWTDFVAQ